MPKTKILQEGQSYTFRSYFEMPYEIDEMLAEFGYSYVSERLGLPESSQSSDRFKYLQQQIEDVLPLIRLSSETARRESLVAPVLLEIARFCQCQIRIEYPLTVNNWLKGTLDYFLQGEKNLLVVEAKKDDLTKGFTQLAVEMIALAQVEESNILYGAVTIGDAWRFGRLDASQSRIIQDITLYRVPDDLEQLSKIMIGILCG